MILNRIFAILSFVLSIFAISVSVAYVSMGSLEMTLQSVISGIGLMITALAFTVGCYFAFIAVRANREMNKIAEKSNEISSLSNMVRGTQSNYAEFFVDTIESQIGIINDFYKAKGISHKKLNETKNRLMLTRSRCGYQYPELDKKLRSNLLRDLSAFGTVEDLLPLKELSTEETDPEIRKIIKKTIKKISSKE